MAILDGQTVVMQHVYEPGDFADGRHFVLCATCQDRITVDTATHVNDVTYIYSEGTVILGMAGWALRAFCSWACAAKNATARAKNLKGK